MSFFESLAFGSPGRVASSTAEVLAALTLAGCVVAPLPPAGPMVMQPGPGPIVVQPVPGPVVVAPIAPPPLMVEPVIAAPAPGFIWIGGYWTWSGGRHVWTRGHWAPPRPGEHWVARQWERGPGGWHQRGGHWAR